MGAFKRLHRDGTARAGTFATRSGRKIRTPFFMPVQTKGASKFVSQQELLDMGTEAIISNALLLHFRPGLPVVKKHGTLHDFVQWPRALFTDSGGFQVISDKFLVKISDAAAVFKNPFDGKRDTITPERAMKIQAALCSDVAMCLDDQPRLDYDKPSVADAVRRTSLWAARCKKARSPKQDVFGIVQGGLHPDLRKKSAEALIALDFDGYAIGGFGIGEPNDQMLRVVQKTAALLPEDAPRYQMGIGSPLEVVRAIGAGVDAFDSAFPTRVGRHGYLFTRRGKIRLEKTAFARDLKPIDKECACFVCQSFSRAYLHHLFKLKEPTGMRYLSHHNLHFMSALVSDARTAIRENTFRRFARDFQNRYAKNP